MARRVKSVPWQYEVMDFIQDVKPQQSDRVRLPSQADEAADTE